MNPSADNTIHSRTSGYFLFLVTFTVKRISNLHLHPVHIKEREGKKSFLSFLCSEADFDPDSYKIPFVVMSMRTLTSEVHSLLRSHEGTLPLLR